MAIGTSDLTFEPERHIVQFYEDDRDLVSLVTPFLVAGLMGGEVVIVVAEAAHRGALDAAIAATGVDLAAVSAAGRYIVLDAHETLSALAKNGQPDPDRFDGRIGDLIRAASAGDRPVRIYGEMVAILWDRGDLFGAISLEALWNEREARHPFSLYCAYPLTAIANAGNLVAAKQVRDHHSSLVTPTDYPLLRSLPSCLGGEAEASSFFAPVPFASSAVRRFITATLTAWQRDDLVDSASVVASELANNALVHAGSPFRVLLRQCDSVVDCRTRRQRYASGTARRSSGSPGR